MIDLLLAFELVSSLIAGALLYKVLSELDKKTKKTNIDNPFIKEYWNQTLSIRYKQACTYFVISMITFLLMGIYLGSTLKPLY